MPAFTELTVKQKRAFLKDAFEDEDGLYARINKMNSGELEAFYDAYMSEEEEDEQAAPAEQEEEERPTTGPNIKTDLYTFIPGGITRRR